MRSATVKKEYIQGKGKPGADKIRKGQYTMDEKNFD